MKSERNAQCLIVVITVTLTAGYVAPAVGAELDLPRAEANANSGDPPLLDAAQIQAMKAPLEKWVLYRDVFDVFETPETYTEVPEEELFAEPLALVRECARLTLQPSVFPSGMNPETIPFVGVLNPKGRQALRSEFTVGGLTIVINGYYNQISIGIRTDGGKLFDGSPFKDGDREEFLMRLGEIIQWPGTPASQFEFTGQTTDVAGVKVHTGQIERKEKEQEQPGHWYDDAYVFITDSVPQYAYIRLHPCGAPPRRAAREIPLFQNPSKPPTAADHDPDVMNRPRFIAALGRAKTIPRPEFGRYAFGEPNLSGDEIPAEERTRLQRMLQDILADGCMPRDWNTATHAGFSEAGSTRAVRQVITWESPFGTVRATGWTDTGTLRISLRVAPEHRLAIRTTPDAGYQVEPYLPDGMKYFDGVALHRLLTALFRMPFARPEDFVVRLRGGAPAEFDGLRFAEGSIGAHTPAEVPTPSGERPWYSRIPFLITESDPQYMAFQIDYRAEAKEAPFLP